MVGARPPTVASLNQAERTTRDNRCVGQAQTLQRSSRLHALSHGTVAAYLAVYLLLDWVSFIHPLQRFNITPWNPPPAIAVALLLVDRRLWWVVAVTLVIADVVVRGVPVNFMVAFATAPVLTGSYLVIARWLRDSLHEGWQVASPRDLAALVAIAGGGALLSAFAYVGILSAAGMIGPELRLLALARYWVGDVVGMVVALPIVLAVMDPQRRRRLLQTLLDWRWWAVAAAVAALLLGLWSAGPALGMDFSYLLLLPMVWGATRFGEPGALLTAGVTQLGLIAVVQAVHRQDLIVFELQMLMAVVSITGQLLGVVMDKLQRADSELRRSLRLAAAGQMSAALAHELGQPLTALATYAQACKMLLLPGKPLTADDQAQLSEVTRRMGVDALRAGEIIRRLRNFFGRGAAELQSTDLAALVKDVMSAQAQRAEALAIKMSSDWPAATPFVLIDRVQMEVVLRNLVANAIEATSADGATGSVTVRGGCNEDRILLEVLDDGPGVRAENVAKVFDGVRSEKPGGMGIGLSISRAIVEAHGGRLWAEPGPHGHFCLTLPIVASRDEGPSEATDAR